ncbi:MAG: metal-dependent hydrolase [Acidimicrobiia bacterium]|nr:metal-dependent hydrolase [Acidimicrobiia bacterium]
MTAAPVLDTAVQAREIRARRISFDRLDQLPKHYAGDDVVMSHVVSVLSAVFPEGEDFFVRTVRNYRDQITDPELEKQVGGFIGQEAIHGREHRAFNDRLAELGYPTRGIDKRVGIVLRFGERVLPKDWQLAITAALEHYTATLAGVLLIDPRAREIIADDEVRHLLLWHALEESEHKAVAFDVFHAVSGNERVRVNVMRFTTFGFLASGVLNTIASLAMDRSARRDPRRLLRSLRNARTSPWLTRQVRAQIRDYNRPGFHPDDHDTTELERHWRNELFGEGGRLADRVARREAAPTN